MSTDIVDEMRVYYARRATTYESVYRKPERQADLRAMEAWLPGLFSDRRVLEVACGTGWWTAHGAISAASWLATDLNPETIAVARAKSLPACVAFAVADAYNLGELAPTTYDAAFAGFWWSHVPVARLPAWLNTLHARLEPGARVVMVDNLYVPGSSTPLARRDAAGNTYQNRELDDGSVHEVLKNFPTREQAFAAIGPRGRESEWIAFGHYWALSYRLD
jgi:SAM-dependent methyltransferase